MESLLSGSAVVQEKMEWHILQREEDQGPLHGGGGSWFGWVEQGTRHLAGLGFRATENSYDSGNACGMCGKE